MGLAVWVEDEAGPYQAVPQPGQGWCETGRPAQQPHEYVRGDTAKLFTLFHPVTGELCAKGVTSGANSILHPWLESELEGVLEKLPDPVPLPAEVNRQKWEMWQAGLQVKFTLPEELPPLRLLLVLDNLIGHKSPALVLWLVAHGVMPLYTPLSGSWLNMAESVQRIIVRRALAGTYFESSAQTIQALEATVRGWNRNPTPFVWGGKRKQRRDRARARRHEHRLGGSGAMARQSLC
jgi:DDE superfamily endonuclease